MHFCLCLYLSLLACQIRFIDNTDPAGIDHQVAQLGPELASTLVIVISKVSNMLSVTSFFLI
jgi:glucose-6-phosphate isomerase